MTPDPARPLFTTYEELLEARGATTDKGWTWLEDGNEDHLPFSEAVRRSRALAAALHELAATRPTDGAPTVLVTTSDPIAFVVGFLGCLVAGAAPVPVPDPARGHPRHRDRVAGIAASAKPWLVLTSGDEPGVAAALDGTVARTSVRAVGDLVSRSASDGTLCADPARSPLQPLGQGATYWQYTSGSSGAPTPVPVTASTALAHLRQAAEVYRESSSSVTVGWVPLHHDMGLVTSVLRPLHTGYPSVLMSPSEFVSDPRRWLDEVGRRGATHVSAPDFGYALCTRKVLSLDGLDLSSVLVARSAGERVRARTVREFTGRFGACGLRATALSPSYGMAEATLTVTTSGVDELPRVLHVDAASLRAGRAEPASEGRDTVPVVSCGRPLPRTEVAVTDPSTGAALPDGCVGEIAIDGPQVVPPLAAARVGHLRRTGDLGFVHDGELYLLGRSADRFQVNGENVYLLDVEACIEAAAPELRNGRVIVVPVDHDEGTSVVVLAEERIPTEPSDVPALHRRIVASAARGAGLRVHRVHLLPPGSIPLTSSGKVRRSACLSLAADLPASNLVEVER
ncbi:AMP-binding protein [Cellulomonas palmilytica]|uniref:AMP-binding protein n=1 Tax=Cellulomonas palmilytica TaxID=2608402 RepID=UPI001F194011|nr:AMP-binding protein [Cellulomonas palmilytica]UJP40684.1 AMP-binding protein [Cellulomonas palmilytica]